MTVMMFRNLSMIGFALILATEACLRRAKHLRSMRWEHIGRLCQAGVIVVYTVIVVIACNRL
jgi:hypothetical protein